MTTEFREFDEAVGAERVEMIDNIAHLAQIDAQIKPLEAARDHLRGQIKQYMQLNADNLDHDGDKPVLWHPDLQQGYVLTTTIKHGYDLVSLSETHPDVLVKAAQAGWLSVDRTALMRHPGAAWVDQIKRYEMALSGTDRLDRKEAK